MGVSREKRLKNLDEAIKKPCRSGPCPRLFFVRRYEKLLSGHRMARSYMTAFNFKAQHPTQKYSQRTEWGAVNDYCATKPLRQETACFN